MKTIAFVQKVVPYTYCVINSKDLIFIKKKTLATSLLSYAIDHCNQSKLSEQTRMLYDYWA
jgi:hypothetical protein